MHDPSLHNEDLAPVPPEKRTWTTGHIAALWIGMAICVPTYTLASERVAGGMSAWQSVLVIALANLIVLVPLMANGHAGTKYGIPFPVLVRASFGVRGAQVPAVLRALVACGWFGIQCWFGGLGLWATASVLVPSVSVPDVAILGADLAPLIWFFVFWLINVYFIWNGMESIKWLETLSAPFLLLCGAGLLVWAISEGGSLGTLMSQPATKPLSDTFAIALTSGVSFWATLALNIPDFSRYARSQRDQVLGQALAMPTTMTLFAFVGVVTTAATVVVYGEALVYPDQLVTRFDNPLVVAISMLGLAVATLSTNIAANVVSPANDFANAFPRAIKFHTGGLITGIIGILMMPWKLLADPSGYIFTWLLGYSGGLGSIAGVLIADYWIVRKTQLRLEDLYLPDGAYRYASGWNGRAVAATLLGCALAWGGLLFPPLKPLYDYAWFVGFGVAFAVYAVLMRAVRTPR